MMLYAANWTHDKSLQIESRKDVLQPSSFCIRQDCCLESPFLDRKQKDVEEGRALRLEKRLCSCISALPLTRAPSQTGRQRATLATCLQQSLKLLFVSITTGRTWFTAFKVNWPVTFKRPEDRRPRSGASKGGKVNKWQATYRPLTTCCSRRMKLTSLLSQTPEHTPLSLILAWRNLVRWQLTEGREDVPGVWRDLETKMSRNCSHVPHPVPHPIEPLEPSSMEALVNLLAELQRHCDIAAICVALSSASVVESQLELVFGHVWCDLLSSEARPCKFVLLYSVARKRFDRTFHSKCPCFQPYNRTSGPDKSAMRIPNLQATTTQSPKDISGGITSCSAQLLLRIVNVQATHMSPLVHAQWHVHDVLDSGPRYLMQLQDLMLHFCLRLFNGEAGLRHQFTKHPRRVAASDLQVATGLLWILYSKKAPSGGPRSEGPWLQALRIINGQVAGTICSSRIP